MLNAKQFAWQSRVEATFHTDSSYRIDIDICMLIF